ncbi:ArsR/SmtB family transcription factor [Methylobacterium persicinum]|uniref:DNA-binding transcriptional ArsR family regulator n=1 Tax=Methylobacterium persicinum TaxID=374426 RepID=A0ABU0HJB7_9HYPH|nr:DNA-binding transcriptional ArsR family regulator [Methylobacterium persicinum]
MLNDHEALTVLSALAQATRLRVMRALLRNHPTGLPAGRIAAVVEGTPSTLSFHLSQLEQAGLVKSRRQANSVIYTAVPYALGGLVTYLMDECCGGRPELCADIGWVPSGASSTKATPCCGPSSTKD